MDFLSLPGMSEYIETTRLLYRHGWAEGSGGNISMVLDGVPEDAPVKAVFPLSPDTPAPEGLSLVITRSGSYMKSIAADPEADLCVLRIRGGGAELLWGLKKGGRPSSELSSHLLGHEARLAADPKHRVLMHTHATHLTAMTAVHPLDERSFTRTLWQQCSECMIFFPDGAGVLPWMPCGTDMIGRATAEKLREFRMVIWAQHGVFGAGSSPFEALGLIEIADKAAALYLLTAQLRVINSIPDEGLRRLAEVYGVTPREGWLDI